MLLSLLRNVVTAPFNLAFNISKTISGATPFAAVLDAARSGHKTEQAPNLGVDTGLPLFGMMADKTGQTVALRALIREGMKQQLASDGRFDAGQFQEALTADMRDAGFDDATIQRVTLNLNRLFAELRALPPEQKAYLREQLDGSDPEAITPSSDAGLMQ